MRLKAIVIIKVIVWEEFLRGVEGKEEGEYPDLFLLHFFMIPTPPPSVLVGFGRVGIRGGGGGEGLRGKYYDE